MKKPEQQSWYSRWFSGNDLLNGLIVILLVLLIIFGLASTFCLNQFVHYLRLSVHL
jgi:hypothetical protein